MGEVKWLTVVSPDGPGDVELVLEPTMFAPAKTFQAALFEAGIHLTAFAVAGIEKEYERLKELGVSFKTAPVKRGPVTIAIFNDTCGNLIQMFEL